MDTTARLEDIPDLTPITDVTGSCPGATIAALRKRWGPVAPVELEPGLPVWLVLGYEEYCAVVRDDETYSRRAGNWRAFAEGRVAPTSKAYAMVVPHENVFFQDGERRRTLRAPIDDGLGRLDERSYARRLRGLCHQLVERMLYEGSADLMTDYAVVVPLLAVAELFGMSEEQGQQMTAAARRAFAAGPDAYDAVTELMATVVAHIQRRRARPASDLTTAFLEHPNLVDDSEVVEAMSLMIIGGYELTIALIVQTLMLMLTDRSFG
ncbi:MAG: hypothetical protein J2O46_10250, partial [Nocardioides sp.]|nr:hypothetical protein [Nocardioides sp.]